LSHRKVNIFAYILFCINFIGLKAQTVIDIDGNVYNTITIDTQIWMAENLKTTNYNNGKPITLSKSWSIRPIPTYCWYKNDPFYKDTFGAYYNWYSVNSEKLCPTDWHVPNDSEWKVLIDCFGGDNVVDSTLIDSITGNLKTPGYIQIKKSSFANVFCGYRNFYAAFWDNANHGYWWSSTEGSTYNTGVLDLNINYQNVNGVIGHSLYNLSVRCIRDSEPVSPSISTFNITDITSSAASSGGYITYDEGSLITARGVCWNTSQNPIDTDSHSTDSSGIGTFTSFITGLTASTAYYLRAYATNSAGTIYGNEIIFITKADKGTTNGNSELTSSLTDIDGNFYTTIKIGSQTWMAENLKTTKYNNGDIIRTTIHPKFDISIDSMPKFQWPFDGNESNVTTYGRLYTWYAITDTRNICPFGWHVPNNTEWIILTDRLGGKRKGGGKFKSIMGWNDTNELGFTGLPGGNRYGNGTFNDFGDYGYWWSSTEVDRNKAWYRYLNCYDDNFTWDISSKQNAFSVRCVRDPENAIKSPTIITKEVSSITSTTAKTGGNVINVGGPIVTARGVCWSTSANPTIMNSCSSDGKGAGTYASSITGLTAKTTYFVRAYATNSAGLSYGNEINFTTTAQGITVADADSNVYNSVTIGTQTWMAENLKTSRFRNFDLIETTTPDTLNISGQSMPKYQWAYSGLENNVNIYGRLYTWYSATDSRNICPNGWHLPNDEEWTILTDYLGGSAIAGGRLKSTLAWDDPNTGATNEESFTGLPGGSRNSSGPFGNTEHYGYWWSSTEKNTNNAWAQYLYYFNGSFSKNSYSKKEGFSVRCLKD
jgi:uncharacterized protein (TIGR02145 family)